MIIKSINKKFENFKEKFYEFKNGHPFLLSEEVDIIIETMEDIKYKYLTDNQIQKLVKIRVKEMYKNKFPNSKPCNIKYLCI